MWVRGTMLAWSEIAHTYVCGCNRFPFSWNLKFHILWPCDTWPLTLWHRSDQAWRWEGVLGQIFPQGTWPSRLCCEMTREWMISIKLILVLGFSTSVTSWLEFSDNLLSTWRRIEAFCPRWPEVAVVPLLGEILLTLENLCLLLVRCCFEFARFPTAAV